VPEQLGGHHWQNHLASHCRQPGGHHERHCHFVGGGLRPAPCSGCVPPPDRPCPPRQLYVKLKGRQSSKFSFSCFPPKKRRRKRRKIRRKETKAIHVISILILRSFSFFLFFLLFLSPGTFVHMSTLNVQRAELALMPLLDAPCADIPTPAAVAQQVRS
jgi:hypothetical protein